jgi:hypothetical protein
LNEAAGELSRFWLADGSRPLGESVHRLNAILADLRAGFLAYVEQRYGHSDRARLEAEIDTTLTERLGYWLFRSLRFIDRRACGELLTLALARGEAANVSARAVGLLTSGSLRRLRQRRSDVRR